MGDTVPLPGSSEFSCSLCKESDTELRFSPDDFPCDCLISVSTKGGSGGGTGLFFTFFTEHDGELEKFRCWLAYVNVASEDAELRDELLSKRRLLVQLLASEAELLFRNRGGRVSFGDLSLRLVDPGGLNNEAIFLTALWFNGT